MPLYMDVHKGVEGLSAQAVAEAPRKDLETQNRHGVNYLRYWFNEADGTVFCLCEAPSKEAAEIVHREAHGLVADQITEVKEGSSRMTGPRYTALAGASAQRSVAMTVEASSTAAVMELNLRGAICPGPTGDTLAALKRLPPGGRLMVTDYPPARQTIPQLVEQRGCSWRITEDDGKTFRTEIVKGDR